MSMGISQPSYYVTRLSIPQDIGPLACYAVPANRGEAENRQGEADRLADGNEIMRLKGDSRMKCKTRKAPFGAIVITKLGVMPYDYNGLHATGRRIYAPTSFPRRMLFGWDEYIDCDGCLSYHNR